MALVTACSSSGPAETGPPPLRVTILGRDTIVAAENELPGWTLLGYTVTRGGAEVRGLPLTAASTDTSVIGAEVHVVGLPTVFLYPRAPGRALIIVSAQDGAERAADTVSYFRAR